MGVIYSTECLPKGLKGFRNGKSMPVRNLYVTFCTFSIFNCSNGNIMCMLRKLKNNLEKLTKYG